MYDPFTGRWVSRDQIGFAGGDPNLYRYCRNSPVNAVDPSGAELIAWGDKARWDLYFDVLSKIEDSKGRQLEYDVVELGRGAISVQNANASADDELYLIAPTPHGNFWKILEENKVFNPNSSPKRRLKDTYFYKDYLSPMEGWGEHRVAFYNKSGILRSEPFDLLNDLKPSQVDVIISYYTSKGYRSAEVKRAFGRLRKVKNPTVPLDYDSPLISTGEWHWKRFLSKQGVPGLIAVEEDPEFGWFKKGCFGLCALRTGSYHDTELGVPPHFARGVRGFLKLEDAVDYWFDLELDSARSDRPEGVQATLFAIQSEKVEIKDPAKPVRGKNAYPSEIDPRSLSQDKLVPYNFLTAFFNVRGEIEFWEWMGSSLADPDATVQHAATWPPRYKSIAFFVVESQKTTFSPLWVIPAIADRPSPYNKK
jgi:hypothetical protein